jgi:hypothetical protein
VEQLKDHIHALEQEKHELKRVWKHEDRVVGDTVSSVTTPGSEVVGMVTGERVSMHSMTPEHFELIEAEGRNMDDNESAIQREDDGSVLSLADTDTEWTRIMLPPLAVSDNTPVDSFQPVNEVAYLHGVLSSPLPR